MKKLSEFEYQRRMRSIIQWDEYEEDQRRLAEIGYDAYFTARHTKNTELKYIPWSEISDEKKAIWCYTVGQIVSRGLDDGLLDEYLY